jgi:GMP synthase-like glutamine amidotransferase
MKKIKVAVLDLNNNEPNLGLSHICQIIQSCDMRYAGQSLEYSIYDVRHKGEVPSLGYDIYISSGGPGSPFDGEHSQWEIDYFRLIDHIWNHNETHPPSEQKYVFFICHSFQLMVRFFQLASVTKRHSMSFGVMPTHKTEQGEQEVLFRKLANPFHVADFRNFQAVQPDLAKFDGLGARILCLEKIRPHIDMERALMAVRISDAIIGTQFHPEADAAGMKVHFRKPEKRDHVLEHHGEEKYHQIIAHLDDPDKVNATYQVVLPTFFKESILLKAGFTKEMILF